MIRKVYLRAPIAKPKVIKRTYLFSFPFLTLGSFFLTLVIQPIVSFKLNFPGKSGFIRPIPDEIVSIAVAKSPPSVLGAEEKEMADYTQANNWFPQFPHQKEIKKEIKEYTISIPRLGIQGAKTIIGGESLEKSLIHYGGTALPGEYGNSVIFGHSVLPIFYNPQNYKTIFSTLPTLEEGDEIFVNFDGITYRYRVFELKVVPADDVSALEQKFDTSYITLVTCVPPGLYSNRLIVRGRLAKI